jgi:hypothetical protein
VKDQRVEVLFPIGVIDVFFSMASRPASGLTQPPTPLALGSVSPGVRWQRCEADHSPPCILTYLLTELSPS